MTIREISNKVRKDNLSKEQLEEFYSITEVMLKQIGNLRSIKDKYAAGKAARVKEALWSIRCSIRYRLK